MSSSSPKHPAVSSSPPSSPAPPLPKSTAGGDLEPSSPPKLVKKKARRKAVSQYGTKKKKKPVAPKASIQNTSSEIGKDLMPPPPLPPPHKKETQPPNPLTKKGRDELERLYVLELERKRKSVRFSQLRSRVERPMPVASRRLRAQWLDREDVEWMDARVVRMVKSENLADGDVVDGNSAGGGGGGGEKMEQDEKEEDCGCSRCLGAVGDAWVGEGFSLAVSGLGKIVVRV